MNRTILLTTIVAIIAVGVTSAYAVNVQLAGDATVTGDLDVNGAITGPTIDAINAAIAAASICPPENVVHWDKVMFYPMFEMENFDNNEPQFLHTPPLTEGPNFQYDIKVLDDPNTVADLNQKIVDKLNSLGYGVVGQPGSKGTLQPIDVQVWDVDYSIVCSLPPP